MLGTGESPKIDQEAIDSFKWVFKQRDMDFGQFAKALGSFNELIRKFLIEGKLNSIHALINQHEKRYIRSSKYVKAATHKQVCMRDIRDPSFFVSDFGLAMTEVNIENIKLLIANLRELNRYHELLELIERYREVSVTLKDRGILFQDRKHHEDLA